MLIESILGCALVLCCVGLVAQARGKAELERRLELVERAVGSGEPLALPEGEEPDVPVGMYATARAFELAVGLEFEKKEAVWADDNGPSFPTLELCYAGGIVAAVQGSKIFAVKVDNSTKTSYGTTHIFEHGKLTQFGAANYR